MPEESIWTGSPSQIQNLGTFIFCAVLAVVVAVVTLLFWHPVGAWLAVIPLLYALLQWLRTRSLRFELTNERLLITHGIFSRVTDALELYRVKDMRVVQPFTLRLFGLENIEMTTTDASSPHVVIDHVPRAVKIGDRLREAVEACRVAKRTREIDFE